jgi:hypothetical protein
MDLFNVERVSVSEEKLHKILPLGLSSFEVYCSPCRMDGKL